MRSRWGNTLGLAILVMVALEGKTLADLPKAATLATPVAGSLYNAIGVGLATVITRHSPMNVRVQTSAGPPAWLPSMESGDVELGVLTSADAVTSYKGIVIYKKPFRNTRILAVGGSLKLSFYVAKNSEIQTVADLKGKRIPTDFPGAPIVKLSSTAGLATAGLTYNEVIKVPVSDLNAGAQAFLEGRTDAGWHTVGAPAVEEANARKGGVRFISVVSTPEAARRMREIYPGSFPSVLKAGSATGVVKDTNFLTTDIYFVAAKTLSEEAAYEILKVVWEYNQELGPAHPALREWTRDRVASDKAFIPYHPGAVKFFKEKAVWSKGLDSLQAKLLSE
ncbi:MAG: TAXI family TRAP transporter solute-binding subunit [Deltaproteobacteria bacterium]|nr:TAXI family TRAP transporter solute-binding subunit [Deltaproteobacteria bacterium]